MYEPYEERRKFKINLEDVKRKIVEKSKELRQSKWFLIVVVVVLIGAIGIYGGYITYTGRVTEITSRITILERQLLACQENTTSCLTNLQTTENTLSSCQKSNQDCNENLQSTESELDSCKDEKQDLDSEIQILKSSITDCESKYNELDTNYKLLESEKDQMECNYAKKVCGNAGLNYYYLKGDMSIVCCLNSEMSSCTQTTSGVTVKEINC